MWEKRVFWCQDLHLKFIWNSLNSFPCFCFHYSPLLSYKMWSSLVAISFSFFSMEGSCFAYVYRLLCTQVCISLFFLTYLCICLIEWIHSILEFFGFWLFIINSPCQGYWKFKIERLEQLQHLFSGVSKCDTPCSLKSSDSYSNLHLYYCDIGIWFDSCIYNSGRLNLKISLGWDYLSYTINMIVTLLFLASTGIKTMVVNNMGCVFMSL